MSADRQDRIRAKTTELIDDLRRANRTRLPAESELATAFGVSRNSVRRVMDALARDGTIRRIQGKGSFLNETTGSIAFSGWTGTEEPGDVAMSHLAAEFERSRGIALKYTPVPYYSHMDDLIRRVAEGTAPDVVQLIPNWIPALTSIGVLAPLDGHVVHNNLRSRYPVDVASGMVGKEIYALTWALSPLVLYWNKTALQKAGQPCDAPPRTLEELRQTCCAVNDSGTDVYGISLPLSPEDPSFLWLYPYFLSFGGGFLDNLGNVALTSSSNLDALAWLSALNREGGTPGEKGIVEGRNLFANDRIAFWVDGPWSRGLFRFLSGSGEQFDEHYGVSTIPVGTTGRSESALWNHSLAITRQCRRPELAYQLVDYLTNDEAMARYLYSTIGMLPANMGLLHTPSFMNDPTAAACIGQMDTVSLYPTRHPFFARAVPFVSQIVSQAILKGLDLADAMTLLGRILNLIARERNPILFLH